MAPIRSTTLDLGRARARWSERFGAPRLSAKAAGGGARDGRLQEVAAFGANPGALRMLAYAPAGLPAKAPLVVVLHGCTQDAAGYDRHAGWTALADELGFAVLYPEQNKANNIGGCFNWFQIGDASRGLGEALSIREMVNAMAKRHDVDPDRVFVTGLSAGGAMTAALLADYPDVFAAGAVIAGLPCGAASNVQEAFGAMSTPRSGKSATLGDAVRAGAPHEGAWPRIAIWHGTADSTVAPANADELVKQWTDVHGVRVDGFVEERLEGRRRRVWRRDGREVVELTMIEGMGHGTPLDGRRGEQPGPFMLEAGVSSTREIASFFGLGAAAARTRPTADPSAKPAPGPAPRPKPAPAPVEVEGEIVDRKTAAEPSGQKRRTDAAEPRAAKTPTRAADRAPARPAGRIDVSAVITNALRTAGLMK